MTWRIIIFLFVMSSGNCVSSNQLVSLETIKEQKALTEIATLSNGIPLIYRNIPNSDILQIDANFTFGRKDIATQGKALLPIMFATMTKGAQNWSKEALFRLTEKYSAGISCSSGIELSSCSLSVINDYWLKLLPAFQAIIKEPTFSQKELLLAIDRRKASLKASDQNPESYSNEVVNEIFYGPNHPYYLSNKQALTHLSAAKREAIIGLHNSILNADRMFLTIATSLPLPLVKKHLEMVFGNITKKTFQSVVAKEPKFAKNSSSIIAHRDIPSAYMRAKFNLPGIQSPDYMATKLMIKILDEELSTEIRTKLSLSYAVYSYALNYQIGFGIIAASTSYPEQTLSALNTVLKKLKSHTYTAKELEEYKNVYATKYFLTLEEHSSLAAALSHTYHYFKSTDPMYENTLLLAQVTPEKVKEMANKYLNNFRLGIVYSKDKIKKEWMDHLVKQHLSL